jgi:predicted DNA-binding protein
MFKGSVKMSYKRQYQTIKVGITAADKAMLMDQAQVQGRTQTEVAREAIRWYLENIEEMSKQKRESEVAQAMKYGTDQIVKAISHGVERICRMHARQSVAIGTIYELTWMSLSHDEHARAAFEKAIKEAKRKMRGHIEKDEKAIAAGTFSLL